VTLDVETTGTPEPRAEARLRVAAAGDVHVSPARREDALQSFASLAGRADLLLLAGDLSTHGEPAQAEVLADACRPLEIPVVAVLGNHDWHANRVEEFVAPLEDAGIVVLDRGWTTVEAGGTQVGVVGTKGFVGGFPGSHLPDFGEPLLRQVYAETTAEVDALHEGLRAVAVCPFRLVVLHYAPTTETLQGERESIWAFLGSDRLAAPIAEHEPDLVVHGHAHAGCFEGRIGEVPVFNVSVPVLGQDFWVFELAASSRRASPIH
jgi:uncharacterized protein